MHCTHTKTHTYARTHAHIQTQTHTYACVLCVCLFVCLFDCLFVLLLLLFLPNLHLYLIIPNSLILHLCPVTDLNVLVVQVSHEVRVSPGGQERLVSHVLTLREPQVDVLGREAPLHVEYGAQRSLQTHVLFGYDHLGHSIHL